MPYFATHLALFVLALFFSGAQALPFTPKVATNRGGADAHLNLGKLNQKANDPLEFSPSGSPTSSYSADGNGYVCNCDQNGPPAELLTDLKEHIYSEPHPTFLLSQLAENIHQKKSCPSSCGMYSKQLEKRIAEDVRKTLIDSLNDNVSQSSAIGPCPSWYNVTFHPNRYPRYLVEIVCSDPSDDSPAEITRRCSYCSNEAHTPHSGHCTRYHSRDMLILTNDPNESGCELPPGDLPTWRKCWLPVVGGCKCGI